MLELAMAMAFVAAGADPQPGIGRELAEDRARRVSGLRYSLAIEVPEKKDQAISGVARLEFQLKEPEKPLTLDFAPGKANIDSIVSHGSPIEWNWVNGHIVLPKPANDIEIRFRLGDASLNRNADFFYSLFVPARAHLAIPCFDQPDLKARYRVEVKAPPGWSVLTNAPAGEETQPLSTYLFHFAAGKFQIESETRDGRTLRMFHRETDAAKVARNREAIFDLHFKALRWMEDYTGIPYPFGKLDFMALPSFQFGGMEHAGAISYNASGLFLDESATQAQKLGRASVVSHETAHMWFGDLVTMKWFNDVWLKEVFANFMAAKMVNPAFPELNHELRFYLAHYRTAYGVDRTRGANAIRQDLANLNDAGSLYGPIIYQKAPIAMRNLEALLGETNFRDGLRDYLKRYSFANATWSNLISILDPRTPKDLAAWSKAWVETPHRPRLETRLEVKNGKIVRLAFQQATPHEQAILVSIDGKDLPVEVHQGLTLVPAAMGLPAPNYVLPKGYGDFDLDPATQAYLLKNMPSIPDALNRANAWSLIWENMLNGKVARKDALDLALLAIPGETDELNIQRFLGDLQNLHWRVPSEAARVEALLKDGMLSAKNRSLRAAYFQTYRATVLSPAGVAWLGKVWRQEEKIPDLPLAEADYTRIAAELALREVEGWKAILDTQLTRITNPDRKAQFAFVIPALDADPAVRSRFFESLKDVKNRGHEPWVLEGAAYLNHPLRAKASEALLPPGLELLREIQRTGDIFFPQRWMAAILNGHKSKEAASIVERFLAALPSDYPPRLRLTVLAAADDLLRVAH